MLRNPRLFVHLCVLLIALALIISGCGGTTAPNPGASNGGAVSDPGSQTPSAGGQSSQGGQDSEPGAEQVTGGDDDPEPFDLSDLNIPRVYEIVSRFQALAFEMTSTDDELDWANITISFNGKGEHAGGTVERYQFEITGPNDYEDVDANLEMWFASDGSLVAVRDLSESDPEVVTEPFVLMLTELHSTWMVLPFHGARMALGEAGSADDITIASRSFSTDTVLGQLVPVATISGTAPDENGATRPFTMRIAQIAGLPFGLEMSAGTDTITVTPTVIELR